MGRGLRPQNTQNTQKLAVGTAGDVGDGGAVDRGFEQENAEKGLGRREWLG